MGDYEKLASEVDKGQAVWISRLREAVKIPSVSADAVYRPDVFKMIDWAEEHLTELGAKCVKKKNGQQTLPDGTKLPLPPVLFATLGSDPAKKTLLVYGHLDVQPAKKEDGWNTEPFELVEKDGKLFGRGSTDDKGPIVAWLNAIEVMQRHSSGGDGGVPVNIKFVLEGMEESGSEGLDEILERHRDTYLSDVDYVCISDNYWLGKRKPCLTYGLRGISYYEAEVTGPKQDLHSGIYGGAIYEPMVDLCWILAQLVDVNGTITIPGIAELVAPVTDEEQGIYSGIDFDLDDFRADIGVKKLCTGECPKRTLMSRWRYPSLSIHGIEGAFSDAGAKTVIPHKVKGKFSIRLVPNMTPDAVNVLVSTYLNKLWSQRGSPNEFSVKSLHGGTPWLADFHNPNYTAGAKAIERVFGVTPDFIREGGSVPVTLTFQNITQKQVMLLPIGACDDMAHSQNEKIDIANYMNGIKTFIAYILELSKL